MGTLTRDLLLVGLRAGLASSAVFLHDEPSGSAESASVESSLLNRDVNQSMSLNVYLGTCE
jgi:hypothetical protein